MSLSTCEDINDNAPLFSCAPDSCNGDVAENSPPGTSVMEMTAIDLDDAAVGPNAVLAYRIVGNAALNGANSGAYVFSINPATGTVSVAIVWPGQGADRLVHVGGGGTRWWRYDRTRPPPLYT